MLVAYLKNSCKDYQVVPEVLINLVEGTNKVMLVNTDTLEARRVSLDELLSISLKSEVLGVQRSVDDSCIKYIVLNVFDEMLGGRLKCVSQLATEGYVLFDGEVAYKMELTNYNSTIELRDKDGFLLAMASLDRARQIDSIKVQWAEKVGNYYRFCIVCHASYITDVTHSFVSNGIRFLSIFDDKGFVGIEKVECKDSSMPLFSGYISERGSLPKSLSAKLCLYDN